MTVLETALTALFATLVATAGLMIGPARRARARKRLHGATGLVGAVGVAETRLDPEGFVVVRGEMWPARSRSTVAAGAGVRVTGASGFRLLVASEGGEGGQR